MTAALLSTPGGPEVLTASPPATDQRFSSLDGLRGVCAITVALHHFWPAAAQSGYSSVDVFFALSGFVLLRAYAPSFGSSMTALDFLKRRAIRFLPLYWVGLVLGLLRYGEEVARHVPGHLPLTSAAVALLPNLAMIPSPVGALLFPFNLPAWSLFDEFVVNALMVIGLWRVPTQWLIGLGVGCGVLMATLAVWHNANLAPLPPGQLPKSGFNAGAGWAGWYIGGARSTYSFIVGMAIGRLITPRARRRSILACVVWVLLLLLQSVSVSQRYIFDFDLGTGLLVPPLLLILGTYVDPPLRLEGLARWFGEVSFGLYMVHFPLTFVFAAVRARYHLPLDVIIPLYLATAIAGGWMAKEIVDVPLRRRMTAWLLARRSLVLAPTG